MPFIELTSVNTDSKPLTIRIDEILSVEQRSDCVELALKRGSRVKVSESYETVSRLIRDAQNLAEVLDRQ